MKQKVTNKFRDLEHKKNWIEYNLLIKKEITNEFNVDAGYFDVQVSRGKLKPFIKKPKLNLYLREDVQNLFNPNIEDTPIKSLEVDNKKFIENNQEWINTMKSLLTNPNTPKKTKDSIKNIFEFINV